MRIEFVEVRNFRRLGAVRIDISKSTTLFVGANNSGKTSGMTALRTFLIQKNRKFSINDLPLSSWWKIDKFGQDLEAHGAGAVKLDWHAILPSLDIWLDVEPKHLHRVSHLLPTLNWRGESIGVRLQLEPAHEEEISQKYIHARNASIQTTAMAQSAGINSASSADSYTVKLWPSNMSEYVARYMSQDFVVKAYLLDPTKCALPVDGLAQPQVLPQELLPIECEPFSGLIRIDEINAQRGFSDYTQPAAESDAQPNGSDRRRLSDQLRVYYTKHLDPSERPEPSDVDALQAIHSAQEKFDDRLKLGFSGPISELENLGYAGISHPRINIATRIRPTDGLTHESAVTYEILGSAAGAPVTNYRLPEQSNGLGYQNLVSMAFRLISFRDAWMRVGKAAKSLNDLGSDVPALIHLVLVEEPEAHLHAQVQQVFIKKAIDVLRNHPDLGESKEHITQLVVSTHSSHIAHETDFASMRYFRRKPAVDQLGAVPTSEVVNLSEVFGDADVTSKFVTRYLKATHCDLFFADGAIFVEGAAERMLVPHFIKGHFRELDSCYLTILEIGGSHAHRFRGLIEHLGLTTLMISDLDSAEATGHHKKAEPKRKIGLISGSAVIKSWLPYHPDIDTLLDLPEEQKVILGTGAFAVKVVYQTPMEVVVRLPLLPVEALSRTFEDSLVLANIDKFRSMPGENLISDFRSVVNSANTIDQLARGLFDTLEKTKKKAEFAMDMLYATEPTELNVPPYIELGLSWLQHQLHSKLNENIVPLPPLAPATPSA
jgi:predicted ATP-dependent endonuclease of OLD family